MSVLLGTNIYAAKGDAERRQQNGVKSLLSLEGCHLMNLQFKDEIPIESKGFETLCELTSDSQKVTGRKGSRKPIVSEMFNILAQRARRLGCRYFGFVNSDIIVSQAALDYVTSGLNDAYAFSRMDFDGESQENLDVILSGADLFIIDTQWWVDNSWRFRSYIMGEPVWDNVYIAKLLCHSRGILLNRGQYVRHERHPRTWLSSPFAQYTRLLAALDASYFSLWVEYWEQLIKMRSRNTDEEEERALQGQVFQWHPSGSAKIMQACRSVKARLRYRVLNALEY